MAFRCLHCGGCCENNATHINLTLGDISRFSEITCKSTEDLFREGSIGLMPFQTTEDPDIFEIELGLKIPCRFRKGKRCMIYGARPLNCRLFPFWIINLVMGLTAMRLVTFYWVSQVGMLPGTMVYVNAGKELAKIDSLSWIMSPGLIVSFVLIGIFPIAVKKVMALYRKKAGKTQTA